jgi:sulfatase maturation enzyme AslB (radical SAM superfamily)
MEFWSNSLITALQIELTNGCNSACPGCPRFYMNSPLTVPNFKLTEISLERFKQYFKPEVLQHIHRIIFCGTSGDACVATDTLEICRYIATSAPNIQVIINTNGGMRNTVWWTEMGQLFKSMPTWHITFSIDGLEDTNHVYRRQVNWHRLMANVKAFISAGGQACWDFLIFKHNEHQIAEASYLAQSLGFKIFVTKKALGVDNGTSLIPMPVVNRQGAIDYFIEAPGDPDNRNLAVQLNSSQVQRSQNDIMFTVEEYQRLQNLSQDTLTANVYTDTIAHADNSRYENSHICCKSRVSDHAREIYIDCRGMVMPCCYVGTVINSVLNEWKMLQIRNHMSHYGQDMFSLECHTLEQILTAGHLDRVFADSWYIKSVSQGRLAFCADICGGVSKIDRIFSRANQKDFW